MNKKLHSIYIPVKTALLLPTPLYYTFINIYLTYNLHVEKKMSMDMHVYLSATLLYFITQN